MSSESELASDFRPKLLPSSNISQSKSLEIFLAYLPLCYPTNTMTAVCEGLVAKLNELMDFLRFARLSTAGFHGVVTFMFRAAPEDKDKFTCMRTIDMRRDLVVDNTTLHPQDPFLPEVAVVYVTLADFLYMYSGEATAAEIAGMVMSGRVSVPWNSYGKLKAFAECFDFSTQKWDAYYADMKARDVVAKIPECTQTCCKQSTKEDIEANWLLVSDATTTTGGGDWEVVSDLQCLNISMEKREQMETIFDFTSLEDWLAKLWNGDGDRFEKTRPVRSLQSNVKNSLSDLKSMAGKFLCRWRRNLWLETNAEHALQVSTSRSSRS